MNSSCPFFRKYMWAVNANMPLRLKINENTRPDNMQIYFKLCRSLVSHTLYIVCGIQNHQDNVLHNNTINFDTILNDKMLLIYREKD